MTVIDTTAREQTEALSFEFDLPHSPAKVWRALTEPTLISQWLIPLVGDTLALAPGTEFTLQTQAFPGWDGKVHCRMLEVEKERKLSYAWVAMDIDTIVTFTLTPTATGTRMTLVQVGFKPDQKKNLGGARYGWKMMGGKLEDLLPRIS
jgi:uncharacterized protein YndB with AHSA1/START domain